MGGGPRSRGLGRDGLDNPLTNACRDSTRSTTVAFRARWSLARGNWECSIGSSFNSSFDSAVCSAGAGPEGRGLGDLAMLFDLVRDPACPDSLKIQHMLNLANRQRQDRGIDGPITNPLERLQTSSARILFNGLSGARTCRGAASIGSSRRGAAEEPESSSSPCSSEAWPLWWVSSSSVSSSLMLVWTEAARSTSTSPAAFFARNSSGEGGYWKSCSWSCNRRGLRVSPRVKK